MAYLIDERGWGRKKATAALSALCFIVGIPSALSYNVLGSWTPLGNMAFFDSIDLIASNYLLPISGLLISIYVGWFWKKEEEKKQLLSASPDWVYTLWHFMIRYVSPLAVAIVLYAKVKESGLFTYIASFFG